MLEDSSPRAYRTQYVLRTIWHSTEDNHATEFSGIFQFASKFADLTDLWPDGYFWSLSPPHHTGRASGTAKWSSTNQRAMVVNQVTETSTECCDSIGWFCSKHAEELSFRDYEKGGLHSWHNLWRGGYLSLCSQVRLFRIQYDTYWHTR